MASLNFPIRINAPYFDEDSSYFSFELETIHNGRWVHYPCTFKVPCGTAGLRSAFHRRWFLTTIERNACFFNSPVLRRMEEHSELTTEFEHLYTGPTLHVYDFCKAMVDYLGRHPNFKSHFTQF